ncbi:HU family DNA-binding protein [Dysgonomonas sp. ZJ279]|uniref:HU family DNA-binding protein n=1 Tax=Dysgonomonas sp. ZJ279 TaxID=2709796 RepID=UPI0013EAF45E|nr:HU family DNA-binding protein [Dysgonomonas sp. ZJ279]
MNERLTLQDLIDLLAKKQEITKKDAELFLRELIALITENIEKNEPVKIKDFGTFKLVKVNSRRSVDVNTGEAIEIAAHYKLSFAPDKSLREAVNLPFSHFESIILEDGVSFDNIEDEAFNADGNDEYNSTDEVTILEEDSIEEIVNENPKSEDKIQEEVTEDTIIIEDQSPEIDSTQDRKSDISDPKEDAVIIKEEEKETELPIVENEKKEITTFLEDRDIEDEYQSSKQSSRKWRYIYLGFFIAIMLACFTIGGLFFNEISRFFSDKEPIDIAIITEQKDNLNPRKTDTINIVSTVNTVKDSIPNKPEITKDAVNEEVIKSNTKSKSLGEETIREGQTLRLIALKYYGNKSFWVYIYQENKSKIRNPNNVPIGTRLVIPSLDKYNVDPTNPQEVKKAQKMEGQIISETN